MKPSLLRKSVRCAAGVAALVALAIVGGGCAQSPSGPGPPPKPRGLLDFSVRFAGPIDDVFHYFVALDTDGDFGADGPIPVAAGPYWENGWGTGSFTHYIEYNQGRYDIYRPRRQLVLREPAGGIVDAYDEPTSTDTGIHVLRVNTIFLGDTIVSGDGMVDSVENLSHQNGGFYDLVTDDVGRIVSLGFRRNLLAGRDLNAPEQAILAALNAGGVALAEDSLAPLGLRLALQAPVAGTQELRIEPATAVVQSEFRATGSGERQTFNGILYANSSRASHLPPIPGGTIVAEEFVVGEEAILASQMSADVILVGPPYSSVPPAGGNQLQFTIEISDLGQVAPPDLSINVITTTDLIFDPLITDPDDHNYDALGITGDEYVTFRLDEDRMFRNSDGLDPEGSGDFTLLGPASAGAQASIDIVDWSVRVRGVL